MAYYIGQALGLVATLCCFVGPFWKKKWQMLVNTAVANLLVALNFLLIGKIGSALALNLVAIVQTAIMLVHTQKKTQVSNMERVVFLILYVAFGFVGIITAPGFRAEINYENILELLPILGSVLLMIGVFVRDEQTTRKFSLANALIYTVYDGIIGTTAIFAQLISVASVLVALYKYRDRHEKATRS